MAKSGSFTVTTSNRYISGKVEWEESSVSEANNTSKVTATLYLKRTNTGYTTWGQGSFTITINGNAKSSGTKYFEFTEHGYTTCVSHTVTVTHSSNGAKSVTIKVSGEHMFDLPSQSGTATLTTIPRASTLSASNGTLGAAQTLKITRASSAFTHTIAYNAGDGNKTIVSKTSATSVSWTPPAAIAGGTGYSANIAKKSVSCTLTLDTYSGSTKIGSKTKTITLTVPDTAAFRPTFTLGEPAPVSDVVPASWGMYVQSLSKASVAVSNAADPYNSTPLSYAVTDGRTTGTAASYTTGLLPSAGTVTLTATVTNVRGYKTKKTKTITVEAYTPPVISSVELQRCLAPETDGTLGADDPMGTYVRVKAVFSCTSLSGHNSVASATAQYRAVGAADWTSGATGLTSGVSAVFGNGGINIANSYEVQVTVTDTLGRTDTYTGVISTSDAILNIYPTGKGMGLGKYAEQENLLDVKWPARLRGGATSDGKLQFPNNVAVYAKLSDGTEANLIVRNDSNNIWIGAADSAGALAQGSIYLATSADGDAYVSRQNVRTKILDYGFVGKLLWEGTWSSGSITVPNTSQYKLFMLYTQTTAGAAMATPILGMKYNNSWIRGPGGYNSASALYISTVAVTLSGNTWTLSQVVSDNLGSGTKTDIVITDIYGLI